MLSDVAFSFLVDMTRDWPPASEEELATLLPEEREQIAQLDENTRKIEVAQLESILKQMKFPSHLAIQYVLLKDDFHRTIGQMRTTPPKLRKELHEAMCKSFERNMKYKLRVLERWYIHLRAVSGDKLDWKSGEDIARAMEIQGRAKMKGCAGKLNPTLPLLVAAILYFTIRYCFFN